MFTQLADTLRSLRIHPAGLYRPLLLRYLQLTSRRLPAKSLPPDIESIFIIAHERLGDAILIMPFLYAFHDRFPAAAIDIACTPLNQSLFSLLPFVRDVVTYKGDTAALRRLQIERRYTLLYNPKDNPSFTFIRLTRKTKADVKVCLDHKSHNRFYHVHLPNPADGYILEKDAALLKAYQVPFPLPNRIPEPPLQDGTKYELPEQGKYIAVNLSAGNTYRIWPLEKWTAVVEGLLALEQKYHVLVFAMEGEREMVRSLQTRFGERIHYCQTETILDAGVFLQQARLLISPDTALIHLAAAKDVPVVGLYQKDERNRTLFAPYGVPSKMVVSEDLTLNSIQPGRVLEAAQELLLEYAGIPVPGDIGKDFRREQILETQITKEDGNNAQKKWNSPSI